MPKVSSFLIVTERERGGAGGRLGLHKCMPKGEKKKKGRQGERRGQGKGRGGRWRIPECCNSGHELQLWLPVPTNGTPAFRYSPFSPPSSLALSSSSPFFSYFLFILFNPLCAEIGEGVRGQCS